ncbi:Alcohol dehydrogenase [Oleispira antarctica RB-8]|uniref:Alcohol dehydrogenase n=1 Tax=Oleispira antarctica RB-8 TaxID=698738 RepID=R4YTY9_OLEAN|nr:Alcohol dehydrogenase [Oleispira antarctica RB-8]
MIQWHAYRAIETKNEASDAAPIVESSWQLVDDSCLPAIGKSKGEGEVLIKVQYSSVNYKDALSASGNRGVTRSFPHTPGIDAAGIVVTDASGQFSEGTEVVIFGYDLGMNTCGGYGEYIRVPATWVLIKPENLTFEDSMRWGTAGFTAALSVEKLLKAGIKPDAGKIIVTGATGGVGSVAVSLLAKLGFEVVAVTGKEAAKDWLLNLGATEVLNRADLLPMAKKPMTRPLYQAGVDTCGGDMIAAVLPQLNYGGALTTCGMVAGSDFSASVFPFIIRGIDLLGVDSVEIAQTHKQLLIKKVADEWQLPTLADFTKTIGRSELPAVLADVLAGKGQGRYLLDLAKA